MSDCLNAEMRDRLPDLLHEQLDESARAAVLAHVEDCVDCRGELALLRETRVALSPLGVISVDVASIARVVVERTRAPLSIVPRRRPIWSDWRIAASILVLAVGAGSVAIIRGTRSATSVVPLAAVPVLDASPNIGASTTVASTVDRERTRQAVAASASKPELSSGGGVGDLSENDLRSLLQSLDNIDAVPSTESDPVTVRVALPGSGSLE